MKKKTHMRKVLGHGQGVTSMVRKGDWQLAKENPNMTAKTGKKSDTFGHKIPEEMRLEVAKEMAGGASKAIIADKYGVSNAYVVNAMKKVWMTSSVGREILKNVILENGIAMGMQARAQMKDLTPMQSVMAAGIMTSKFVELDKHTASTPQEVDFNQLQEIGEHMKQVAEALGVHAEDMDEEDAIDV